ncbi:MAG: hypothetical protein LBQ12_14200 [Deltaproteobacteria bacterium]|jgi:hypothetical protein|nr:hypothetical protein [Deltaproteobacteria bacterium]
MNAPPLDVFSTADPVNRGLLDDLRAMRAKNVYPPLPPSPRVMSRTTKQIFMWNDAFARRPEAFMNCDESGNTDPATWEGRFPEYYDEAARRRYLAANPKALPPRVVPPGAPKAEPVNLEHYSKAQPLQGVLFGVPQGF